jgi:hypothetical protein
VVTHENFDEIAHTMPGPFLADDDGRQHRSALSDYCISIHEQHAEERKQCIPETSGLDIAHCAPDIAAIR